MADTAVSRREWLDSWHQSVKVRNKRGGAQMGENGKVATAAVSARTLRGTAATYSPALHVRSWSGDRVSVGKIAQAHHVTVHYRRRRAVRSGTCHTCRKSAASLCSKPSRHQCVARAISLWPSCSRGSAFDLMVSATYVRVRIGCPPLVSCACLTAPEVNQSPCALSCWTGGIPSPLSCQSIWRCGAVRSRATLDGDVNCRLLGLVEHMFLVMG